VAELIATHSHLATGQHRRSLSPDSSQSSTLR
jgi:hypothetical protein